MNEPVTYSDSPLNLPTESWFQRLKCLLWGYDFFISYHWKSGGTYAVALAQRLRDLNYEVFLDNAEFAMGDDWIKVGKVALRTTQRLILIATKEAVTDSWPVELEVATFGERDRQIIPILFGSQLVGLDRNKHRVLSRISGSRIHIKEEIGNLQSCPSEGAVSQLVRTARVMRKRNLRAILTLIPFLIVAAFAAFATISWANALISRNDAVIASQNEKKAAEVANEERKTARRQLANTETVVGLQKQREGDTLTAIHRFARAVDTLDGNRESEVNRRRLGLLLDSQPELVRSISLPGNLNRLNFSPNGQYLALIYLGKHPSVASAPGTSKPAAANLAVFRLPEFTQVLSESLGTNYKNRLLLWGLDGQVVLATTDDSLDIWKVPKAIRIGSISGDFRFANTDSNGRNVVLKEFAKETASVWDILTGERLTTLTGHIADISTAEFSPDGTRILTAAKDRSYREWDSQDGELLRLFSDDDDYLLTTFFTGAVLGFNQLRAHARYSPDGTEIVTGGSPVTVTGGSPIEYGVQLFASSGQGDSRTSAESMQIKNNFATVYDADSGKILGRLDGYTRGPTYDAIFSRDNTRILTLGTNGDRPKIWDNRGAVSQLPDGMKTRDASFTPDSDFVTTFSPAGIMRIWNGFSGKLNSSSVPHAGDNTGIHFCPNADLFVTGTTDDNTVKFWRLNRGRISRKLKLHRGPVSDVAYDAKKHRIMTCSWDSTARIWDLDNEQNNLDLKSPYQVGLSQCRISPDGTHIATADGKGRVFVWDETGMLKKEIKVDDVTIPQLEFSPNGRLIAAATYDRTLNVIDAETLKLKHEITASQESWNKDNDPTREMKGVPPGRWIAYKDKLLAGQELKPIKFIFSKSGDKIVTAFNDSVLQIWNAEDGRAHDSLEGHTDLVNDMSISPLNDTLATVADDKLLKVWSIASGEELQSFSGHKDRVIRVVWGPAGKRLATSGLDGQVIIWDASTGQAKYSLDGHSSPVWELSFSPDGAFLGTGALDGTAILWDSTSGRRVGNLSHHHRFASHFLFLNSDQVLTAARDFSEPVIWDIGPIGNKRPLVPWIESRTSSTLTDAGIAGATNLDSPESLVWNDLVLESVTHTTKTTTISSDLWFHFHNAFREKDKGNVLAVRNSMVEAKSLIGNSEQNSTPDRFMQEANAHSLRLMSWAEEKHGNLEKAARLANLSASAFGSSARDNQVSTYARLEIEMLTTACRLSVDGSLRAQSLPKLANVMSERSPFFDKAGIFVSGRLDAWQVLAIAYQLDRKKTQALVAFKKAFQLSTSTVEKHPSQSNVNRMTETMLAMLRSMSIEDGNIEPFETVAKYLSALGSRFPTSRYGMGGKYNAACAYAIAYGKKADKNLLMKAVKLLESVEAAGYNDHKHISTDLDLKSLYDHALFKTLLARFLLPYMKLGVVCEDKPDKNWVEVTDVVEKSPALRAGIRRGDKLVSIDGFEVNDREAMSKVLIFKRRGDRIEVVVNRDGKILDITVELDE